ncbi:MAG: hypothetical protein ACI4RA_07285 [Kiritimatiellia bacterium]
MKITAIRTIIVHCFRTNWVFVKVATDEVVHGIGEGTLTNVRPPDSCDYDHA